MTAAMTDYIGQTAAMQARLEVKTNELWEANCAKNAAIADAKQARADRDAAINDLHHIADQRDALADELAALRRTIADALGALTSPATGA